MPNYSTFILPNVRKPFGGSVYLGDFRGDRFDVAHPKALLEMWFYRIKTLSRGTGSSWFSCIILVALVVPFSHKVEVLFCSRGKAVSEGTLEMVKYWEIGLETYSVMNKQPIRWFTAMHRCLAFAVWEHRVMTRLFIMPLCLNTENFPGFLSRLCYPLIFHDVPSHIGNYRLPNKWVSKSNCLWAIMSP